MKALLLSLLACLLVYGAPGSPLYKRELESKQNIVPSIASNGSSTPETPLDQVNVTAKATRFDSIEKYLPTIKNVFIFVCGFSTFLIACLVFKIFRSGKRIRKTRKYDIITTPAERVEMAPLNEDNYEEDDSAVLDVKYRYR
ncbi:membrane protein FAM174B [Spea bombifrons]|uniref:membrane protein FAM174B n=1 Tax=Spea bombifrons TaxID=233779 RepID=UPI00234B96E5|nr:membrane protein FAM174B [Spea bombifrons]